MSARLCLSGLELQSTTLGFPALPERDRFTKQSQGADLLEQSTQLEPFRAIRGGF